MSRAQAEEDDFGFVTSWWKWHLEDEEMWSAVLGDWRASLN